jgi:hypothetical protein
VGRGKRRKLIADMSDELERAKVAIPWTDMNIYGGAGIHGQPGMKCGYDEHGTWWCGRLDFSRKGNSETHWLFVCAVKEQKVHLAPHGQVKKECEADELLEAVFASPSCLCLCLPLPFLLKSKRKR